MIVLSAPTTTTGFAFTLIVTVSILAAHLSSFTVSEKVYTPFIKLDTVVVAVVVLESVAVDGHVACLQLYDVIVPSLSDDVDPSSVTVAGTATTLSTPAFAIG